MITGRVELQGAVKFHHNRARGVDGGAVYLLASSQLFLQDDTQLEFIRNTGKSVIIICLLAIIVNVACL